MRQLIRSAVPLLSSFFCASGAWARNGLLNLCIDTTELVSRNRRRELATPS